MDRLDQIRQRLANSTGGPWAIELHSDVHTLYAGRNDERHGLSLVHMTEWDWNGPNNRDFIAHSRADMEWAVEEIERLRERLDMASRELEHERMIGERQ